MRIVSGTARGRALQGPKGAGLRPTSDRVRESLFNVLGQTLDAIEVLDLFAGTGALGLEAVSRGAARALLVDSGKEAQGLCRTNADALGFGDRVEIWPTTVAAALEHLGRARRQFPLIFADPPYGDRAGETLLQQLDAADVLAPGGLFVLEHDKREALPPGPEHWVLEDQRAYGDTRVSGFRRNANPPGP